jgi:serine/threonine protein kinase
LIGRGGYGEVWRAIAPGGIAKAVKIVYGDVDTTHADSELRSLARIKDVRHPLLLSIERIEVICGNLIIITELADNSLKDQFQKHREAGLPGVPQDELLQLVSDAADALDFLYAWYSLQHLDVKPENILIVSGRAKVGDFGLVKNLYERSVLLVGGLAPTYAPPELFEGRPTSHSDQYSLAIVYAHMLTGVLPFNASNTAQLAALHLRGVPDLSALPKRQRPVIARELSKDPLQRFDTCAEMVAALKESVRSLAQSGVFELSPASRAKSDPDLQPTVIGPMAAAASPAKQRETDSAFETAGPTKSSARCHPGKTRGSLADESTSAGDVQQPVILVAIGGTGVRVLSRLVNRLHERLGDETNWPPLSLLAIDSNPRELNGSFHDNDLARVHLVPIPLKPADAMGSQAGSILKWLGRRWFYNMPRDLTTSKLRPLGRLALVTNGARVREGIATALSDAASRFASCQGSTGGTLTAPRVILVGSICGGTAGGAIIDLAYAIRSELKRRQLADDGLHGILLHALPRGQADRDMARANAFATLNELQHFSRPGGHFPGEALLGAMPFHGDNAIFGHTQLIDLGLAAESTEHDQSADQVAEFLYSTSFAADVNLLEPSQCDSEVRGGEADATTVHSYEVLSLGAGVAPAVSQAVRLACGDVIRLWQEGSMSPFATADSTQVNQTQIITLIPSRISDSERRDNTAHRCVTDSRLGLDSLLADAAEVIRLESGSDTDAFVRRMVDEILEATKDTPDRTARAKTAVELIDQFFHADARSGASESPGELFFRQIVARLTSRVRDRVKALSNSLQSQVDAADVRIDGTRRRAVTLEQYFQSCQKSALATASALRETAITIGLSASTDELMRTERSRFLGLGPRRKPSDDKLRDVLKSCAEASMSELAYRIVGRVVPVIDAELATLIEHLDRLSRDLNSLVAPVRNAALCWTSVENELPQASPVSAAFHHLLFSQLRLRRIEMALRIDEALKRHLFEDGHGIRRFLNPDADMRQLWQPLQEQSRRVVLECLHEIRGQVIVDFGAGLPGTEAAELVTLIAASFQTAGAAEPVAGTRRILIVPDDADSSRLQGELRPLTSGLQIIRARKCDLTLCTIRTEASLGRVADAIIVGHDAYRELAGRLYSRVDIAWQGFHNAAGDGAIGFADLSDDPSQTADIAT